MRCPFADWRPSPNFRPGRPAPPGFIVVHISDGGPLIGRLVEHLQKPRSADHEPVSAHFAGGRAGELVQLVDTADQAWDAKRWNGLSIGIEHTARTPGELRTWNTLSLEHRAALVADPTAAHSPTDPGILPTPEMLRASARLVAWLCRQYGWPADREHIRGHCECPGTTHLDCARDVSLGGIWPWGEYLDLVRLAMLAPV